MKKIAGTGSAGGNEEKWDTSLWVAGRYALRLAKEDAGLPYQAIAEGGLSAYFCRRLRDRCPRHRPVRAG